MKRLLGKFLPLCLVLVLFTNTSAYAVIQNLYQITRELGETTTYTNSIGTDANGMQKANIVEYTPNSNVSPMIAYGTYFYGKSTITKISDYLEQKGYDVIAGINADFFDTATGIPIGIVIQDGILISSSLSQYAVGFMDDGSAIIGKPTINMSIQGPDGKFYTIDYYNKTRNDIGLFLLDSTFASETKISTSGTNIILERTDDTPVTVGGKVTLTVVGTEKTASSTQIADNQMILTISDKGPTARFPSYNIGDTVNITITPPDSRWAKVTYAVGGKCLIENGTVSTSGIDGGSSKAPRTAVGIKDNGNVVLYEIDGRQSSYSVGLTAKALAEEMAALGCTQVLCLDGGGSSAMVVQQPGDSLSSVVNKPSDGSLRSCANYIFLVNKEPADSAATKLHLYPDKLFVLPYASVNLTVKATDDGIHPQAVPEDVVLTSDRYGTMNGATFTAGETPGTAVISASSPSAYGSYSLFIPATVSSISANWAGKTISGLTLQGGETADLSASATYQGLSVAATDKSFAWSVSGNIGSITEDGVFTAVNSPASGSIRISYGDCTKSIPVSVGIGSAPQYKALEEFESSQPFTAENGAILTRVTAFSEVFSGKGALKITANGTDTLSMSPADTNGYTYLSVWAKGTASGTTASANFILADGTPATVPIASAYSTGLGYTGWNFKLPENAVSFTGFDVSVPSGGALYLDHLILSEREVVNQYPPKITALNVPESVSAGGKASLSLSVKSYFGTFAVTPSDITATVDGQSVTGTYNTANGTYTLSTPALSAGIHRVTVKARDISGIWTTASYDIAAGSSAATFADTAGNWASNYIEFAAKKGILIGSTSNGKSYFYPKRSLSRGEFAVSMARYLKLDTNVSVDLPFEDAADIPAWALPSVKAVYDAGIMNGSVSGGKTYFHAGSNITRCEVMTVLGKALEKGYYTTKTAFTDASSIPSWSADYVYYLSSMGVISGYTDGSIRPLHDITREEIAKVIYALH